MGMVFCLLLLSFFSTRTTERNESGFERFLNCPIRIDFFLNLSYLYRYDLLSFAAEGLVKHFRRGSFV